MRGRGVKLSAPRKLVGDLMALSIGIPRVTVQRRMELSRLIAAREASVSRPSWPSILIKAYALLAQEEPALRRAYVKLPWPHLYEYPQSVALISYERKFEGEDAVLLSNIKLPAQRSLAELSALIRATRSAPIKDVREFRRALSMARWPALVRRMLMWLALNLGRQRAIYFGTFHLSVYSALGAESFNPLSPVTTLLNYGPIDSCGEVNVRVIYDHRVMDGATVARALARLQELLNGVVADEVRDMAANSARDLVTA